MTELTRRGLLKVGASAAALALIPRPLLAHLGGAGLVPLPPIEDSDIKALALRAVDASRAAGATYADVRLTHTYWGRLNEAMHVGVRALVNGVWGFGASPIWSPDEMARLGAEAVHQAKANAFGQSGRVELAPVTKVVDGHWTMPVKIDPFTLDPGEVTDVLASLTLYADRYPWTVRIRFKQIHNSCDFVMQEKAFASTEGSYCTQRHYLSRGVFGVDITTTDGRRASAALDFLTPAGVGWELYRDHDLREAVRQILDEIEADLRIPVKPVEVGRYDTAFDARGVASLLDATLGRATELDRAMGYEANATGTSFLNDPFDMVGSYQVGAEALSVTANRGEVGGAATVRWDDENVAPDEFTLVQEGVLTDFQTMRESAVWLKDHYASRRQPLQSHGCASAPTAREAPLIHTPNLVMAPGREAQDFDALVRTLKQGIAIKSFGWDMSFDMDFQSLNGLGVSGKFYQVKDGERVARFANAGLLFRAPELWKAVRALGGAQSVRRYGLGVTKGEPPQETFHSVTAPPALFEQLTVIDVMRKA